MAKTLVPGKDYIGCRIMDLPEGKQRAAADEAILNNLANRPTMRGLEKLLDETALESISRPQFLSVLTSKYWGKDGVDLSVSFMENTAPVLRDKILEYMNRWNEHGNVKFKWSQSGGEVRISRGKGGYYSYLGNDILHISRNEQTMNLEGFVLNTPEVEYRRVVCHETGHTLGFPHEHMRRQIIAKLDVGKTIDYFRRFQNWNEQTTRQQVLTPIEETSIMGTADADEDSIMCYSLPASITKDGKGIKGGDDINATDAAAALSLYPFAITPVGPVKPPVGFAKIDLDKKTITFANGLVLQQIG